MATTRPDDIGSQFPSDAADSTPADPTTNRSQIDYFSGPEGRLAKQRPQAEGDVDLSDAQIFRFQVTAELDDSITGRLISGGIISGAVTLIAKPRHLRKGLFDGEEVNDIEYTYINDTTRIVLANGARYVEELNTPYVADDTIVVAQKVGNGTDVAGANYLDINSEGRHWQVPDSTTMTIKSVHGDYLICTYAGRTEEYYVVKPYTLRRSPFEGKTVNGFSYTYTTDTERVSTKISDSSTETQLVTQDYFVGAEIEVKRGAAITVETDITTILRDANDDSRAWAKE